MILEFTIELRPIVLHRVASWIFNEHSMYVHRTAIEPFAISALTGESLHKLYRRAGIRTHGFYLSFAPSRTPRSTLLRPQMHRMKIPRTLQLLFVPHFMPQCKREHPWGEYMLQVPKTFESSRHSNLSIVCFCFLLFSFKFSTKP